MDTRGQASAITTGALPRLPEIAVIEFRVRFFRAGRVPEFRGYAYRGAFGRALRMVGCARDGSCGEACRSPYECPVGQLFETPPPPPGPPGRFAQAPHPVALRAPSPDREEVDLGHEERFGWAVLAPAWRWLPAMHAAVGRMGEMGIGSERAPFEVAGVEFMGPEGPLRRGGPHEVSPPPCQVSVLGEAAVELRLETPLRIEIDGTPLRAWSTREFVRSLVRRAWVLAEFYGGERAHPPRPESLSCETSDVRVHWDDRSRYSARQDRKVPTGGLMGSVTLSNLDPLLAWLLSRGSLLQVGKGTAMGMGRYSLEPVRS